MKMARIAPGSPTYYVFFGSPSCSVGVVYFVLFFLFSLLIGYIFLYSFSSNLFAVSTHYLSPLHSFHVFFPSKSSSQPPQLSTRSPSTENYEIETNELHRIFSFGKIKLSFNYAFVSSRITSGAMWCRNYSIHQALRNWDVHLAFTRGMTECRLQRINIDFHFIFRQCRFGSLSSSHPLEQFEKTNLCQLRNYNYVYKFNYHGCLYRIWLQPIQMKTNKRKWILPILETFFGFIN